MKYHETLDERFLSDPKLIVLWVLVLALVLRFLILPVRNFALVCWVYGSHAYFHDGIRVLLGKPTRFSDGAACPNLPDIVTGFGAFVFTYGVLTALLIFGLRIYERHFRRRRDDAAQQS